MSDDVQIVALQQRCRALEEDSAHLMRVYRVLGVAGLDQTADALVKELQDRADRMAEALADLLQSTVYEESAQPTTAITRILQGVKYIQDNSQAAMPILREYWEMRKRNVGGTT